MFSPALLGREVPQAALPVPTGWQDQPCAAPAPPDPGPPSRGRNANGRRKRRGFHYNILGWGFFLLFALSISSRLLLRDATPKGLKLILSPFEAPYSFLSAVGKGGTQEKKAFILSQGKSDAEEGCRKLGGGAGGGHGGTGRASPAAAGARAGTAGTGHLLRHPELLRGEMPGTERLRFGVFSPFPPPHRAS